MKFETRKDSEKLKLKRTTETLEIESLGNIRFGVSGFRISHSEKRKSGRNVFELKTFRSSAFRTSESGKWKKTEFHRKRMRKKKRQRLFRLMHFAQRKA